ncbi:hypothetical protein HELRODRAFT_185115 [Helobdella robusta]|uniref:Uridine 5'-monophosphate synthase n=1 Tax=Helobdella robusta TaxID=6412 RepID=T1FME8_HELRO|nr:hypothetical protein HELRODRAFT_185115 [Helobdella robusta]ESN94473.1 hypothetical protein HELRODRAFT_185115 [Helobdella robusta]
MASNEDLVLRLYDVGAIKCGEFKLSSGLITPLYFDLRVIISYPEILVEVSDLLYEASKLVSKPFKSICGVPYTALPIATLISAKHKIPMLLRRREAKEYGTKKAIEGHFEPGDICLVIEDVVTSGLSVYETILSLQSVGVHVSDAVVLLERSQGATNNLKMLGVNLHSIFTLPGMMEVLVKHGKLEKAFTDRVLDFLINNQTTISIKQSANVSNGTHCMKTRDLMERAKLAKHEVSRKIFEVMYQKQTNLCLSADVTNSKELLHLAESIGPYICVLKTHVDIIEDFDQSTCRNLLNIAHKHNFVLFEDRKFADIGHTVSKQFTGGMFRISEWADVINAHPLPGPGIIKELKNANKRSGCLLIGEMSTNGNLITPAYTKATLKMAEENDDFVIGFISTSRISHDPHFLHFTPGVSLDCKGDGKGQQYLTPSEVVSKRGADILIVGRGITLAHDPVAAAKVYAQEGFSGYLAAVDV